MLTDQTSGESGPPASHRAMAAWRWAQAKCVQLANSQLDITTSHAGGVQETISCCTERPGLVGNTSDGWLDAMI